MRVDQLLEVIRRLDPRQPLTDSFECPRDRSNLWYESQKDHLLGWLGEYGGPGAYRRSQPGKDARFFYHHFQCAPGLLYLAEALGEDHQVLRKGMAAVLQASPHSASQSAAFRRAVPWERIEELVGLFRTKDSRSSWTRTRLRQPSRLQDGL